MPERSTAQQQLQRLLHVLPAAARAEHEDGASLHDLAAQLDVEPATLIADLQDATARAYYQDPAFVDTFSIFIEGERVAVFAPQDFTRPVRLNVRESAALELGLRVLAADSANPRRAELLALAERLGRSITVPDTATIHGDASVDYDPEDVELALGDDGFRSVVADAIERATTCTLIYLKSGAMEPARRTIVPQRLVYADGRWYVVAYDIERAGCRTFRLDRTLDVLPGAAPEHTVPECDVAAMLRNGVPYHADEDVDVVVRYSAGVARWISERIDVEQHDDGSVSVTHSVADPRWIVRHVMQFGGEAAIEAPPFARAWIRDACSSR